LRRLSSSQFDQSRTFALAGWHLNMVFDPKGDADQRILASRASTWLRDHFCRSTMAPRASWAHDVERVLADIDGPDRGTHYQPIDLVTGVTTQRRMQMLYKTILVLIGAALIGEVL
jgi:hypothetical protein